MSEYYVWQRGGVIPVLHNTKSLHFVSKSDLKGHAASTANKQTKSCRRPVIWGRRGGKRDTHREWRVVKNRIVPCRRRRSFCWRWKAAADTFQAITCRTQGYCFWTQQAQLPKRAFARWAQRIEYPRQKEMQGSWVVLMAHHLKLIISTHSQKGKISHVATTNDVEERDYNFERVSNFRAGFFQTKSVSSKAQQWGGQEKEIICTSLKIRKQFTDHIPEKVPTFRQCLNSSTKRPSSCLDSILQSVSH